MSSSDGRVRVIRPELERALGVALALLAAGVAITCGSRGRMERSASAPNAATAAPVGTGSGGSSAQAAAPIGALPVGSSSPERAASGTPGVPKLEPAVPDPTQLGLPHFFADLASLERHGQSAPVRILWLGDSHTAADYLTGALRARLQARFGAGGPGFVRVGVRPYRHSQMHWACDGPWRIEPPQPARRAPFDDGVFGLGGMRASPGGAPAYAAFEVLKGSAHGQLRWQLWFSLAEGATFRLELAGASQVVTRATAADAFPGSGLTRLRLTSSLVDKLQITTLTGAPRFFGLTVEGSEPGLVLDAVGVDGARLATALAWGEDSFETAVAARSPSLVAFAFGTNEAFDADKVEKYRAQYQALLGRVRKAAPSADCLIVGPPDANATRGGSEPRVQEIDTLERSVAAELGCGYLSQLEIMGGPGGYSRWEGQIPQLARGDRLHLTAKGYERMAQVIGDKILAAYGRAAVAPAK